MKLVAPLPTKLVAVTTPAMLTLSAFKCPSTSKSPFKSIVVTVVTPDMIRPFSTVSAHPLIDCYLVVSYSRHLFFDYL